MLALSSPLRFRGLTYSLRNETPSRQPDMKSEHIKGRAHQNSSCPIELELLWVSGANLKNLEFSTRAAQSVFRKTLSNDVVSLVHRICPMEQVGVAAADGSVFDKRVEI